MPILLILVVLLGGCNSILTAIEDPPEETLTGDQHLWWSECVKFNPNSPNACFRRAIEALPEGTD